MTYRFIFPISTLYFNYCAQEDIGTLDFKKALSDGILAALLYSNRKLRRLVNLFSHSFKDTEYALEFDQCIALFSYYSFEAVIQGVLENTT